ncbi:hypothetical protein [Microbacterium sp. HJ5]
MNANRSIGPDGEVIGWQPFGADAELHTLRWPDGRNAATLVHTVDRDVSASDLRALADAWEAYPAWLRARADELEGRA